ncbi:MAG TPA: IPT/TIG domain-containing protein [Acidimicrobiales bacterium]
MSIAAGVGLVAAPIVLSATPAAAVTPAATVTGLSPVSGIQAGGNVVTIRGTNLGTTGTTLVHFGAASASSVTVNANGTSLVATAPSNPNSPSGTTYGSTFDVTVDNGGGSGASALSKADRYTYEFDNDACGSGGITTCQPATMVAQETTPITGTAVTAAAGGADLIQVPVGANVSLTSTDAGDPSGSPIALSILDVSTNPPTIENHVGSTDGISPHAAVTASVTMATPGQAMYLTEADHCAAPVGGFPNPPAAGCALTPTGGNSDPVVVQWGAATVTLVSPSSGPLGGGTSVTLTGTNFTGATAVNFGGTAGTGVVVNSATSITVVAPAEAASTADISVVTPAGTTAISASDQFTYSSGPTVSSVTPSVGPTAGGTSVTVQGANLSGATAVNFGTKAGTGVAVNGAGTSLMVNSPLGAAGTVDITVTTPGGTSPTSAADQFTYKNSGYWMVGNDGGIFSFGGAPFEGSLPGLNIHVSNVVGAVPTSDSKGYWMIGSDGGVFAFGDAGFVGSIPGLGIHVSNIVGAVPTSDGKGYWMVGSDGGVFAFGDAGFVGSLPGLNVHVTNVVGAVPTSDGKGYWMVGSDGGVFAFGDAGFVGSLPGLNVHVTNVVGVVSTSDGKGYWMVGTDGGVFAFGDATFVGSIPGLGIHVNNIVAFARQ